MTYLYVRVVVAGFSRRDKHLYEVIMPELPEVETIRRGLLRAVTGCEIVKVVVRRRDLRMPIPPRLETTLKGLEILGIRRRAKYLLMDLGGGQTLLIHLGMSGSLVVRPGEYVPQAHDHVLIHVSNGKLICFNDPRRFGVVDLLQTGAEAGHALLAHLGPEPFSAAFSPRYLATALRRRKGPIKAVLMDQRLVVGVGNIYASEALHLCGVHPECAAHEAADKSREIIKAIRETLKAAIASGGSTLRDYVGAQNEAGYFQHQFRVYGRKNDPCFTCAKPIQTSTHAGRSTYWCAKCQQFCGTRRKS